MLARAKDNLRRHFVVCGLTDRFDETVVLFSRVLGWKTLYYASERVNPQRMRREDVSAAALRRIAERNVLDEEVLRFARELFDQQVREYAGGIGDEAKALRRLRPAGDLRAAWTEVALRVEAKELTLTKWPLVATVPS